MKHSSQYLDWYIHVPKIRHNFLSSGIVYSKHVLNLGEVDLSVNYDHGNPKTKEQIAKWYRVKPENLVLSSEGASGQSARIIRCLAERNPQKKEALVEYPTYEPLLRSVQEHFPRVKRLERKESEEYAIDPDRLRKIATRNTGVLVLTNPHAPSGAISDRKLLQEVMSVAREHRFFVVCDEIYAEFERAVVPTLFSVDPEFGIVTTSFTKAYGLGGLKLGIALADTKLVDEIYTDVLNTVGNSANVVQIIASELVSKAKRDLQEHKAEWKNLKKKTEEWLTDSDLKFLPNKSGVTYWVTLPVQDTFTWTNRITVPKYSVATVPGAFFLFEESNELMDSNKIRIGLGAINPQEDELDEGLETLGKAIEES
jgi:aspartate/methionine/tyrosine aminotransferase